MSASPLKPGGLKSELPNSTPVVMQWTFALVSSKPMLYHQNSSDAQKQHAAELEQRVSQSTEENTKFRKLATPSCPTSPPSTKHIIRIQIAYLFTFASPSESWPAGAEFGCCSCSSRGRLKVRPRSSGGVWKWAAAEKERSCGSSSTNTVCRDSAGAPRRCSRCRSFSTFCFPKSQE